MFIFSIFFSYLYIFLLLRIIIFFAMKNSALSKYVTLYVLNRLPRFHSWMRKSRLFKVIGNFYYIPRIYIITSFSHQAERKRELRILINRHRTTSIFRIMRYLSDYVERDGATRMEIVVLRWCCWCSESAEKDGEIYAGSRANLWRVCCATRWKQEWTEDVRERERCDYVARVKQKIGRRISPVSGIGLGHDDDADVLALV